MAHCLLFFVITLGAVFCFANALNTNEASKVKVHKKRQADFLNFPPLPYYQSNNFYQQQHPFPQHQPYHQPLFRQNFQSIYQQPPQSDYPPFLFNEIHRNPPSPFIQDYPSYQQFPIPQYDDFQQDLSFNKVPAFREPIQIIPSQFPTPIERLVERIQNYFSVYNPSVGVVVVPAASNTNNATEVPLKLGEEVSTTTQPDVEGEASSTNTPSEMEVSSTAVVEEETTTEESSTNEIAGESSTLGNDDSSTESSTEAEKVTTDSSS